MPRRVRLGAFADMCPSHLLGAARLDVERVVSFSLMGSAGQHRGAFCARGAVLTRPRGACGTHRPYAECDVCEDAKDEKRAERRMGGKRYEQQDAKDYDKIAECELDPPVGVQHVRRVHAVILSSPCKR